MNQGSFHPHREIVRKCKSNDRKAQQELYQLYARPMFNVCYRIVNQQEEAEDVLQESFIKMFNQLHSFREESSFGAWFKRIVINGSLNHIRKKKRTIETLDTIKDEDQSDWTEEEAESPLSAYTVNQVQGAMELLPTGYRLVFSLYLFEDYSHQQIADELGISISTSKSQLNRAKEKMRNLLKQTAYGSE